MLLGQFIGNATALSVGAQTTYVASDDGYIARVAKDGSDLRPFALPSFTSAAFSQTTIAEDGNRVFFVWNTNPYEIVYCNVSSCDSTITPVGGPYSQFFSIDVADHRIAWIDYQPSIEILSAPTTGTVAGAAIPGGQLPTGSNGSPLWYARGGLYFANGNVIERIPLSGGAQTIVTSATQTIAILGTNTAYLYVYDGSSILFSPLPSGNGATAVRLADATFPSNSSKFAVDDGRAYWIANGGVVTCELANCSGSQKTVPLPTGASADSVGIDESAVYAAGSSVDPAELNADAFTVWKVAK